MIYTELMNFLIFVNKKYRANEKTFVITMTLIISLLTIFGILIDIFFPLNRIVNILKAILVLGNGMSLFALSYTLAGNQLLEDRETFRTLYSYNQRINIALIITFVSGLAFSLLVSQTSPLYCLFGSILVTLGFFLLTFVRPTEAEYLRSAYGIKDGRDVRYSEEVRKRTEEFKAREKKNKKKK